MAKAFTQPNKDQIKSTLLQKGQEYFIKYGLKKTSVDELARAAGIAKGSFYRFFDSKEALFFAVHEESERKLRTDLMQRLESAQKPADKLRLFLKNSFLILEDDPLLRVALGTGEFESLSGLIGSEQYREHYQQGIVFMEGILKQWQKQGIVRQLDVTVASNLIASVFYLYIQRETLGEEMYDRVTDMLIECLVSYLCGPE